MTPSNDFKYNVIQFLEVPYKDVAEYVCVPRAWVHSRGPDDRKVKVSYPVEDPLCTENRVIKRKRRSDEWKSYLSVIKYKTDCYDDAKRYIQQMTSETQNADNTPLTTKTDEKPRRSTRKAIPIIKINVMDAVGPYPTTNNKHNSANTVTLKRKNLTDKEVSSKRSRLTEQDKSDDEDAELSQKTFDLTREHQPLTPEVSDEDMCTEEIPDKKPNNNNNKENRPSVIQNRSQENSPLLPQTITQQEMFGEFCQCVLRELQTNLQSYVSSLFTQTVYEILNNVNLSPEWRYNHFTSSNNTTAGVPKLNGKKINEEQAEKKDINNDADDDQPLKKKSNPKPMKKVVLPPEYDEDDSRWTLKYREAAPGLVELIPHTGVYIKALKLTNCKRVSKECKTLARMLLTEIFTTSALSTCSWTGARAKAFDQDGTNVRPGLDEHARTVLLNYVAVHAKKEGWKNFNDHAVVNSMRNKMQEMRFKYRLL